jgi:hypothetical protein
LICIKPGDRADTSPLVDECIAMIAKGKDGGKGRGT